MKTKFAICILLLSLLTLTSYSNEDGTIVCCGSTYSIFYDSGIGKLLVCCMGFPGSINIVDPASGDIEGSVLINGNPKSVFSINNGNNLLVLTSGTDHNRETKDSLLSSINISTGQVDAQIIIDNWTTDMVIDSTETYAYVSSGLDFASYNNNNKLIKYSLPDLTYVLDVSFISECEDIEISPDGEKLFAQGTRSLWTFNTSDLSVVGEKIFLAYRGFNLKMGYDNRLFTSVMDPVFGVDYPVLTVIDTVNNEIINSFNFGLIGIDGMDINPVNHKLYGLVTTKTLSLPDEDILFYEHTNMILEMDLNDYTYRFITVGSEPLWEIAVAHENDMNRLFCRVVESNIIHYKDF